MSLKDGNAVIFNGKGLPLEKIKYDLPDTISEEEILVEISLATVWGSDVHTWLGHRPFPTPSILGHEMVGKIIEMGSKIKEDYVGNLLKINYPVRVGSNWIEADDYITKPFSQLELLARINALLRRSNPSSLDDELKYKDTITMNLKTYRVKRDGSYVKLNPKEFDLLRLFMENPGKVFSRDQLLDKIWGNINVEPRTVDVHIRRLRKNININKSKDLIRTVRSSGYSLDIIK